MPRPWLLFRMLKHEQSYKHHVERIAQDLSGFEPEVCLAVRLARASSRSASPTSDEEGEEEDDGEIDGFLSSRGFEYIDATEKHTEQEGSESDAWSNEIPGMERVLDALSTIMWPSMQPTIRQAQQSPQTREREHALLDWANASHDNGLTEIEDIVANSSEQLSERTKAMKLEMQELARWLEEDDALRDDPWKSTITSGGMSTSPTEMGLGDKTPGTIDTFGFDDDFTVFVSAPAFDPSATVSGCSTPEVPTDGLAAPHAGSLYHSLGSVSDFGGSEDGRVVDDDDDLPTKEEIMATSSQIFGPPKFPLSPTIETRPDTSKASNSSDHNPPGTTVSKASLDEDVDAFATEANGVGSYHMEHFDLTKVLGTLQEMKTEISAIEDEGERRKAAARVALGLVYGLEADTELL
ncbi:hypothetical protein C0991_010298 [Blastosporella zonata]|nr:hypothetical protein C0991_010298 [Blastosporella zonata]